MPSFIWMRPTVWPQYTNVTNRTGQTDRQRSDSVGRTVLETIVQKRVENAVKNQSASQPSSFIFVIGRMMRSVLSVTEVLSLFASVRSCGTVGM